MKNISLKKLNMSSLRGLFTISIAPHKQFRIIVICCFILVVLSSVFHVYVFNNINSRALFQSEATVDSSAQGINEKKLAQVLARFEEKKLRQESVLTKNPAVVNPEK